MGSLSVMGGITALFLPETLWTHLPNTLDESEAFGSHFNICSCPHKERYTLLSISPLLWNKMKIRNLKHFFRYFKLSFISFSILTVPEAKEMKKKINLWSHKIKTQDRIMEHRKIYIWLQANHLKPRIHFAQCQNAIQMTMMTSSLKRIALTQQIKKFPGTSTSQSIN